MPDFQEVRPIVAVEPATGADAIEIDDLIRRHQGLVRAACVRQSPPAQIDDCVQAVFLVLARKSKQAAQAPSIEAWLLGVARLVCSTARRDDARRRRAEQGAAVLTQDSRSAAINPAFEYLDVCLAGLPERQRAVLCQHFLAGHSRDKVARNLGIGIDAVHQHCHRGLQRLRALLQRRGVAMPGTALVALLAGQTEAATTTTLGSTFSSINTLTTTATQTAATYANGACMTMTLKILIPFGLAAASLLATGALGWMVTASEPVTPAVVPAKTVQNDSKPIQTSTNQGDVHADPKWQPLVLAAVYDLRDVLMQVKDFPSEPNGAFAFPMPMAGRRSDAVPTPTCAEALRMILDPALAAELEPAAVLKNNVLILSATPVMHARMTRSLEKLRQHQGLQCNTNFRIFSMPAPHRHTKYPLREFAAQGRIKELPGQPGLVLIVLTSGEVEDFTSTIETDKAVTTSSSPSMTQFSNQLANFNSRQGDSILTLAYTKTGSGVVPTPFATGE